MAPGILTPEQCGCQVVVDGPSLQNSPVCSGTILFMTLLQSYLWGRCDIAEPCKKIVSEKTIGAEYDYIVIGAGSAGSIVAGRLSEDAGNNVLLLEAGGPDPIAARVPSFYRTFWENQELDWGYYTTPGDYCLNLGDKGCFWPRGKVLGGTSVLNGMMYHRGHKADYDDMVQAGAVGWGWEDNKKYFAMTEGNRQIGSLVSEEYHSSSGPLPVGQFNYQPPALFELINAINETGIPIITDMNDPNTPEGFSIAQTFNKNGQRYTTARAFLAPKSERPNLSVRLYSHVTKVLFEGKRAVAVQFVDVNTGESYTVRATKEIILSAGALNTPHILFHSGIGPSDILKRFDIALVEELPVGQNLRNHIGATLYFVLEAVDDTFVLDFDNMVEYLQSRQGPMSGTGLTQLTGIMYSSQADREREQPDMQFFFNGFYAECSRTGQPGEFVTDNHEQGMNVSANAVYLLPKSVGYVTLKSSDPLDAPVFEANYFAEKEDMIIVKEAMRVLKKIFDSKILQEKYQIKLDLEYTSQCDECYDQWSDEWVECMIRYNTDPQNHQIGTAAVGTVLDPNLKVKNIKGLRVADASAIPTLMTGNPQAAIMMVAERAADEIRKEHQGK